MKKVLLMAIAIASVLVFTTCKKEVIEKLEVENTKLVKKVTTLTKVKADCEVTKTELEECEKVKESLLPPNCRYHVIVGSFLEERRADNWVREMERLAYKPLKVKNENDFYCVYIWSGNSLTEANNIADNVRYTATYISNEAWVFDIEQLNR